MSFIVLLNFAWRPMQNATTHRTPTPGSGTSNSPPLPPAYIVMLFSLLGSHHAGPFIICSENSRLAFLSRHSPCSPASSVSLSLSHSLSVQLSAKFIKNKLALGTVLVWLPNSRAVFKQLVSLLSMLFLRLYLAVLCLISER